MCFHGLLSAILRVRASAGEAVLSRLVLLMLTASLSAETQAQMAPLKARSFRDRVVDKIARAGTRGPRRSLPSFNTEPVHA